MSFDDTEQRRVSSDRHLWQVKQVGDRRVAIRTNPYASEDYLQMEVWVEAGEIKFRSSSNRIGLEFCCVPLEVIDELRRP